MQLLTNLMTNLMNRITSLMNDKRPILWKIMGLGSHDEFMHFSAHFGMSMFAYLMFYRISHGMPIAIGLAILVGLVYKYFEGINPNDWPSFWLSIARNVLGIVIGAVLG